MIYYWYLESVCSAHVYSSATVIVLFTVLTVAVHLAGFWYAIGGQHIYKAAMKHRKETYYGNEMEKKAPTSSLDKRG